MKHRRIRPRVFAGWKPRCFYVLSGAFRRMSDRMVRKYDTVVSKAHMDVESRIRARDAVSCQICGAEDEQECLLGVGSPGAKRAGDYVHMRRTKAWLASVGQHRPLTLKPFVCPSDEVLRRRLRSGAIAARHPRVETQRLRRWGDRLARLIGVSRSRSDIIDTKGPRCLTP